jgi:hypothetical protein
MLLHSKIRTKRKGSWGAAILVIVISQMELEWKKLSRTWSNRVVWNVVIDLGCDLKSIRYDLA